MAINAVTKKVKIWLKLVITRHTQVDTKIPKTHPSRVRSVQPYPDQTITEI